MLIILKKYLSELKTPWEIEKFQELEEFKITISKNIEFIDKIILKIREFESLYNLK